MAERQDTSSLPVSAVLTVTITVLTGMLLYVPLQSLREEPSYPDQLSPIHQSDVRARLWEDPLSAVEEHHKHEHSEQPLKAQIHMPLARASLTQLTIVGATIHIEREHVHRVEDLIDQLLNHVENHQRKITLLLT